MSYNPYQDDAQFYTIPAFQKKKRGGGCLAAFIVLLVLIAVGFGIWKFVLSEQQPAGGSPQITEIEYPAPTSQLPSAPAQPQPTKPGLSWGTKPTP